MNTILRNTIFLLALAVFIPACNNAGKKEPSNGEQKAGQQDKAKKKEFEADKKKLKKELETSIDSINKKIDHYNTVADNTATDAKMEMNRLFTTHIAKMEEEKSKLEKLLTEVESSTQKNFNKVKTKTKKALSQAESNIESLIEKMEGEINTDKNEN